MYIVTVLKGTFALNILFYLLLNFKGKCTVTAKYMKRWRLDALTFRLPIN